jgi:hypothetical protein
LFYEKVTQYGQGFRMLGITRQDFLDQDSGFDQTSLSEEKIRKARFEEGLFRIFLEFVPDFLFSLRIPSALFKTPDTIWQFFPIHDKLFEES